MLAQDRELGVTPGNADRAASGQFGDLADHLAHSASGARDDDRIARLRPPELQQREISRHTRHSENSQRRADRGQRRIDLANRCDVGNGKFLPAKLAFDEVANGQRRNVTAKHLAHQAAGHHLPQWLRSGIGPVLAHADSQVRVDREIVRPYQHLIRPRRWNWSLNDAEIVFGRLTHWSGSEHELPIDACSHACLPLCAFARAIL